MAIIQPSITRFVVGEHQQVIVLKMDFSEIGTVIHDKDVIVVVPNLECTRLFDNWPPKTLENGAMESHDERNLVCYLVVKLKKPLPPGTH